MPLRLPHARPRTVATLAAAACVATIAVAPAASAHSTRGRIALHTTSHRTVVAPAHVRPGLAELHNGGRHSVIVISGPAHRAAELAADTKRSGPSALAKHFAIRGEITPHHSIYLKLSRGTLYLIDMTRAHVTAATVRTVQVTGGTRNASVPSAHSLAVRPGPRLFVTPSIAHGSLMHVTNSSTGIRYIELLRIGSHTTDAQLADFVTHPNFPKLSHLDVVGIPDFVVLSAHRSEWMRLVAPRGRYAVVTIITSKHHSPSMATAGLTVR